MTPMATTATATTAPATTAPATSCYGNNSTGNNCTGNNSTGNNSTGNNSTGNNSTGNNSTTENDNTAAEKKSGCFSGCWRLLFRRKKSRQSQDVVTEPLDIPVARLYKRNAVADGSTDTVDDAATSKAKRPTRRRFAARVVAAISKKFTRNRGR
uniref:Uncharacterized protein n=1 Tax=Branchiostoma floridae TaxID=7739 RepID=C3YLE5_BRAFL|eukprot:XP_002602870.1 hypothetical protein BRAFLDRAFT_103254 [Branchiostoma floridae]